MDTIRRIILNDQTSRYSLEIVMNVAQKHILETPQKSAIVESKGLIIDIGENTFDNNPVIIHTSFIDSNSIESLNTAASMIDQDGNDLESDNMFDIIFKD